MTQLYSSTLLQPNFNTVISLEQAKNFLKISHNADDSLLHKIIRAVEKRAETITNIAFLNQTWSYRYRNFIGDTIELAITPIIRIQNILISNKQGNASLLPDSNYEFENNEITFSVTPFAYNLDVEFSAGHKKAEDIDEDLIMEMLTHIAFLYENRSIYIEAPEELYKRFKKINF